MTDSGDELSRRYRELPRAEPPAGLDAAILAASRRAAGARPRSSWMVPTSIAAVLVLGIGVSLRIQLEQPGIETSPPKRAEPPASPAPEPPAAQPVQVPKDLARTEPAPREERARGPAPERKAATPLAKESNAPVGAPPPAAASADAAEAKPFADARVATEAAAAAQAAPAPRAKREAFAPDSATRESRALGAVADPDPALELERIARLREAARHEEADRALAEFRRRHPEHRIPEAMWERVKPR